MKQVFSIALIFFVINTSCSQKHNYFWTLGYGSTVTQNPDCWGGTNIDFNTEPPTLEYIYREMNFQFNTASICDELGNLIFYTNGISIKGREGNLIENGDGLNPGYFSESLADNGYAGAQATIILPIPERDSVYGMFHLRAELELGGVMNMLLYTEVDMRENNGKGLVMEKNITIVEDTLTLGQLSACKHANGRDWWVIVPKLGADVYHTILFTPEGIFSVETQELQNTYQFSNPVGQAIFSPDGSQYARYDPENDLHIYDFNRCTGQMFNRLQIEITDFADSSAGAGGIAYSPNSQFIYVSSIASVYQFDVEAEDIAASKMVVAEYDNYESEECNGPTGYFLCELAPNDKIYISCPATVDKMHVINQPNEKGAACDFGQHAIDLPTKNAFGIPHYPNYQLGALEGSACDTLTTSIDDIVSDEIEVSIYPNPAATQLTVEIKDGFWQNAQLYNMTGRHLQTYTISQGKNSLDISDFPAGIYMLELKRIQGESIWNKVLIQR